MIANHFIILSTLFLVKIAGHDNISGSWNSFFGFEGGGLNRMGNSNSFFGDNAGYENTVGKQNSFFGRSAGSNNEGSANSFFGYRAGYGIYSGDSVICIGANSGPSSSVNNRLYIDVQVSDDSLIYGEFDNDFVRINGTFEVTAGLTNPSSITLKENFVPVDRMEVLNKITQLDIQEWSYKGRFTCAAHRSGSRRLLYCLSSGPRIEHDFYHRCRWSGPSGYSSPKGTGGKS
ncbi:MAG: tail fiber domain-containing protein [Saprospiraceae bacterium]|nr:tail fiber domain-containing protein [Saprospiraceae bacterium]